MKEDFKLRFRHRSNLDWALTLHPHRTKTVMGRCVQSETIPRARKLWTSGSSVLSAVAEVVASVCTAEGVVVAVVHQQVRVA